jgi:hypothetical protein
MIENRSYTSPVFTADTQGRIRTWPMFAERVEPDDVNPDWPHDVPTEPLPMLVQPGVRHDPMVGESRD